MLEDREVGANWIHRDAQSSPLAVGCYRKHAALLADGSHISEVVWA